MASIVKRGQSYAVVYMTTINGARKQKWETYRSQAEAERRKEIIDLSKRVDALRRPVHTVSQLMDQYMQLYGCSKWALSTYRTNCGLIRNYICPLFGAVPMGELTPLLIAELYRELLHRPRYDGPYHKSHGRLISAGTVKSIHKVLHSAFEQAVLWGYVPRNPFHNVVLPKQTHTQRAILAPEQIFQLMARCENVELALAVHLAFAGTLRKGELLALTWEDVDWESGSIYVRKTLSRVSCDALRALHTSDILFQFPPLLRGERTVLVLKDTKTISSRWDVYLPKSVMACLRQHQQHQAADLKINYMPDLIFCHRDGRPWQESTLTKMFHAALERVGLPKVSFHSLRHSSITYKLVLTSGDIKAVQGDSGHAQAEMVTEVYGHVLDQNRRNIALLFEREFYLGHAHISVESRKLLTDPPCRA